MPPKSYIKYKDAYYDDIVNPLESDSADESNDSFIIEDEDEERSSRNTESSEDEDDEETSENDNHPSSSKDPKNRSGRSVRTVNVSQKNALEKIKSSREKMKLLKTKELQTEKKGKSAKKAIDFGEEPALVSPDSNDEDSDEIISPKKDLSRKRQSQIESSEEDNEDDIKSPKHTKSSRIELTSESD